MKAYCRQVLLQAAPGRQVEGAEDPGGGGEKTRGAGEAPALRTGQWWVHWLEYYIRGVNKILG